MTAPIDLTGRVFGRLTVRGFAGNATDWKGAKSDRLWRCDCSCGSKEFVTRGRTLKNGETTSCGCIRVEYGRRAALTNKDPTVCRSRLVELASQFGLDVVQRELIRLIVQQKQEQQRRVRPKGENQHRN